MVSSTIQSACSVFLTILQWPEIGHFKGFCEDSAKWLPRQGSMDSMSGMPVNDSSDTSFSATNTPGSISCGQA
eukprot:scaffold359889_cov19-Prasinocladus_malaysianus.AAC.2